MGLAEIASDIKELLDGVAAACPVSLGIRSAGDASPCIVFEINSAEANVIIQGVVQDQWTLQVQVDCIADKALDALGLADQVLAEFTGPMTQDDYTLILAGASAAARVETPDDGQADAERIVSLTLTIIAREN